MALRILNGEPVSGIAPKHGDPVALRYDWRHLRRWNIPMGRIPADAEILYQPEPFLQHYGWWVAGVLAAVLIESILIAVLLLQRRRARRSELEVARTREEISHLNRIGSMGELAASLAHELNQPLSGILSNAQAARALLNRTPPDLDEVYAALQDIQEDDVRAGEVIRRMRVLVKKGSPQFTQLDVNSVVKDAAALLTNDAQLRGIELITDLADKCSPVKGDAVQLQQVILNLGLNAMETINGSARRRVLIRTTAGAQISASDSGPGIPPEVLDRVFRPFFSTKDGGLGMGLSISKSIVEAHGGRLLAENSGSGATFRVILRAESATQ